MVEKTLPNRNHKNILKKTLMAAHLRHRGTPSCFHLFTVDCGTALFQIRYSAVSWPLRFSPLISFFFFFLCGCILRGAMSFGMLVSIFEMFWNDVCIHLHSQVQIEPWICKFGADVCGSLRSARFIEEFVYTRMHIHTRRHAYTLTYADFLSPLPSQHGRGELLV